MKGGSKMLFIILNVLVLGLFLVRLATAPKRKQLQIAKRKDSLATSTKHTHRREYNMKLFLTLVACVVLVYITQIIIY
jgi:hypothetical protein